MIVLPDVHFLVAATIVQHEFHRVSRRMLIEDGGSSVHVALLTEVVSGYVRIMARVSNGAVTPAASGRFIRTLADGRRGSFTRPSHHQLDKFLDFMRLPQVQPGDATNAMIAAGAIDLDATVLTFDRGFARFPGLRWRLPGEPAARVNPP